MQHRIRDVGIALFTIILLIGVLYLIAAGRAQQAFDKAYEACMFENDYNDLDFNAMRSMGYPETFIQEVQACHDQGGCFMTCATPCTPTKPFISIAETFSYLSPRTCAQTCTAKCLYPKHRYQ